jgi:hypothetical protein
MKRLIILSVLGFLFLFSIYSQVSKRSPYTQYLTNTQKISIMDWSLVQINLLLGEKGYFVEFNKKTNFFTVTKFIRSDLVNSSPNLLRENLTTTCRFVEAVISLKIPAFNEREGKDLTILFIIGDESARHFATYSYGNFSFTDEYYEFKKENEK